ncbi:thioether cross-link-forming SCIFF peptide maturase [Clostridia bacterium]|nr:thioether cross-link-forming SCIFF peptide maturase [Clostridia bacterium]
MVHTYNFDNKNIVLDVDSGIVHVVSDEAYAAISATGDSIAASDVSAEVAAEIEQLRARGLLYSEHDYSAYARGSKVLKSLCLHVAHDCNLRCGYCFAGAGEYGGSRGIMTADTARAAVDFLVRGSGGRKLLEIDFFGGEPLLAWDTVTATVDYAAARYPDITFSFTITTNGLLLDDAKTDYINEHMYNVVLSLDGRRSVNDKTRPTESGAGSYDVVAPKFRELVRRRTNPADTDTPAVGDNSATDRAAVINAVNANPAVTNAVVNANPTDSNHANSNTGKRNRDYYVRATFTRDNLDFAADVRHIYDLGFRNISAEPCTGSPYGITEADVPRVLAEYETLYHWLKTRPDALFFHFNIDLNLAHAPCIIRRLRGCGCGTEYAAVTPDGAVYPCHQYAGTAEYRLGDVWGGIDPDAGDRLVDYFADTNVYSKAGCSECFAKYYCGGGCNALFKQTCGSENTPADVYCTLMRKRVELAIAMQCG